MVKAPGLAFWGLNKESLGYQSMLCLNLNKQEQLKHFWVHYLKPDISRRKNYKAGQYIFTMFKA